MIKRDKNWRPRIARSAGFTLIEVLVSLVIMGIGMLGIAKLMLFSARANDSAYLRSQANALAYEILDDMRANRAQAIAGSYTTAAGAAATNPGFSCISTVCAPPNLALYDIYQWKLRLNATSLLPPPGALPNGQGAITTTLVGSETTVVITVSWDDSAAQSTFNGAGLPTQSVVLETVL
jgi:type IV pilus assembly protein PilV